MVEFDHPVGIKGYSLPVSRVLNMGTNGKPLSASNPDSIRFGDSPSIDAFNRLRVSNPQTLFDSKNIFNDPDVLLTEENQPLFYDNQETAGAGTSTAYDPDKSEQVLSVSLDTAGKRVRQTKMRFNYQPGKSQLIIMTFNLYGHDEDIIKREGIFDDDNGLFLELSDDVYLVQRSKTTGAVVDTKVAQSDWNVDKFDGTGPSGFTLDFEKTQILLTDMEWLGVGRVRMGFVINGIIYYAHSFNNANNLAQVYMQTPNLPLRSSIENTGTGAESTMSQICATVISEGGSEDLGVIRYASTGGTHLDANTENTAYAVLGIRQKTGYLGAVVKLLNIALQLQTASHQCEWFVALNPTIAGTFTYTGESNSAIEVAKGVTANTVTDGYLVTGGFIESAGGGAGGGSGSVGAGINTALNLGSLIDGTRDNLVLCVRPVGGSSNVDIEGSMSWRELV